MDPALAEPRRSRHWSAGPRTTEPPELAVLKTMDRAVPWIRGGLLVFALLVAGIVVLIVRSNRRRRAAVTPIS